MKKRNILKKNEDFSRIIKQERSYKYKDYIIYREKSEEENYHIGISVGKKVGNAVIRNKIKRQIKSILDKLPIKKSHNYIIIIKKSILEKKYQQIELELRQALENIKALEENK